MCGERDRGFLTSFFHHHPLDFSQSSLTDLTWTVLHLAYRRRDVLARSLTIHFFSSFFSFGAFKVTSIASAIAFRNLAVECHERILQF